MFLRISLHVRSSSNFQARKYHDFFRAPICVLYKRHTAAIRAFFLLGDILLLFLPRASQKTTTADVERRGEAPLSSSLPSPHPGKGFDKYYKLFYKLLL